MQLPEQSGGGGSYRSGIKNSALGGEGLLGLYFDAEILKSLFLCRFLTFC